MSIVPVPAITVSFTYFSTPFPAVICGLGPIPTPVQNTSPMHADNITTRASIPWLSHNGHIRHRQSCLISTLPTQHPPCFSWRWRGWPARQDVGWQCRSLSGMVCSQQRCADQKIQSALICRVWPKIHIRSPKQYAIFTSQLVRVWMFPYTHSTKLYEKMPRYGTYRTRNIVWQHPN